MSGDRIDCLVVDVKIRVDLACVAAVQFDQFRQIFVDVLEFKSLFFAILHGDRQIILRPASVQDQTRPAFLFPFQEPDQADVRFPDARKTPE